MAKIFRPELDEMLLWKIRNAYPDGTKDINGMKQVLLFAIEKALEYSVHMKYCDINLSEVIKK